MNRTNTRSLAAGAGVAALVTVAVFAFAFGRSDRYEAEAAVEVTPVAAGDETFSGFSVLREGQDPVETAAQLLETRPVADAVAVRLRLSDGGEALDHVDGQAEDGGRVVRVRAHAATAIGAAQIANAFADELIRQRSSLFQSELQRAIESLRDQLAGVPATRRDEPPAADLARRLAALRAYEGRGDPTLRVAATATAPKDTESPSPAPILVLGLPLALLLGAAAALAVGRTPWPPFAKDADAQRMRRREERLKKRVEEVTARERELARRAAAVTRREGSLEEREAAAPPPEPAPGSTVPAPEASVPVAVGAAGAFTVERLEKLLRERADTLPATRREELRAYIDYLRPYANLDGTLPKSFDPLVDEVFGFLLRN